MEFHTESSENDALLCTHSCSLSSSWLCFHCACVARQSGTTSHEKTMNTENEGFENCSTKKKLKTEKKNEGERKVRE